MKITVVEALDHFMSSDRSETDCLAQFIGELVEENEKYVILRYYKGDLSKEKEHEEFHNVLKKLIIARADVEVKLQPVQNE